MGPLPCPPAMPRPAYRVGVFGPVGAAAGPAAAQLDRALRRIAAPLIAAARERPLLRLVTSLEPGLGAEALHAAQRLAQDPAYAGLIDLQLDIILPHDAALAPLAPLLAAAEASGIAQHPFILDGDATTTDPTQRQRARREVARCIMRNSDLLVVLCDGFTVSGGSAETELLRHAARFGPNLLWLCNAGAPPRLVADMTQLLNAHEPRPLATTPAEKAHLARIFPAEGHAIWPRLSAEVTRALTPPGPQHAHPHGLMERALVCLWPGRAHPDAYADFLREQDHTGKGLWAAYGQATTLAARPPGPWSPLCWPRHIWVALGVIALLALLVGRPRDGVEEVLPLLFALGGVFALLAVHVRRTSPIAGGYEAWRPPVRVALALAALLLALPGFAEGWPDPVGLALGALLGLLAWRQGPPRPPFRVADPPELPGKDEPWFAAYHAPDRLAIAYANRYRSSYVIVIALIALALIAAILGLAWKDAPAAKLLVTMLEFVLLLGIAGFVAATIIGRWQERWVSYRLLAELCRKQEALARLGWSLPSFEVATALRDGLSQGGWVGWHFNALLRATPLPPSDFSPAGKLALRAAVIGQSDAARERDRGLIQGQIEYHAQRKGRSARIAASWAAWGEIGFLLTTLCVFAKLALKGTPEGAALDPWLGLLAAALPAASAAFFALRAYSEEKLMSEQARAMQADLEEAKLTLEALPLHRPLMSQELGLATFEVAQRMLADVAGWAQLVRVKVVEAG